MANKFKIPESNKIIIGNISIHYLTWEGDEPTIILLHPNRTNSRVWDFVINESSLNNKYIAWDARGYGDSDDYEGALKFEDFSHDLVRLLDSKNIDKAHLVGLSMGARILMDFYPKYKKKVQH